MYNELCSVCTTQMRTHSLRDNAYFIYINFPDEREHGMQKHDAKKVKSVLLFSVKHRLLLLHWFTLHFGSDILN